MYQRRSHVAIWHAMTFVPTWRIASTAKLGEFWYNSPLPPQCRLGAYVSTTLYPEYPRLYILSLNFFSCKIPTSILACPIPRNANSKPPFCPFRMLYDLKWISVHLQPFLIQPLLYYGKSPTNGSMFSPPARPQPPSALLPHRPPLSNVPLSCPRRPSSCQTWPASIFPFSYPLTLLSSPQHQSTPYRP